MNSDIQSQKVGGAAVIVKQNGETVYKNTFGSSSNDGMTPLQEDAIYRLASLTKPVTAVAAAVLIDEGKISLDDPIEKYLPEFKERYIVGLDADGKLVNVGKANNKVTIKNILTHTSAIGSGNTGDKQSHEMSEDDKKTLSSCVQYFSKQGIDFEPGTKEKYSAFAAFDVLAAIIEKISGEDYNTFLKKNVCIPCDMKDTTFVPMKNNGIELLRCINLLVERI